MSDLISAKEAVVEIVNNALHKILSGEQTLTREYEQSVLNAVKMVLDATQPEIIRCKECRHYGCILYSGTQFEYGECFGHEESDYTFEVKPDDFCSRAERRTDE